MHSGTRFMIDLFTRCGYFCNPRLPVEERVLDPDYVINHYPPNTTLIYDNRLPVISTLQHPERMAVSWLTRNKSLNDLMKSIDSYIVFAQKHPVIMVDLSCSVDTRCDHFISVFRRANILEPEMLPIIKDVVEKWEPVGDISHPIKTQYLIEKTLPKYNWNRFERYINWYERQHDNIPS
jgi:hypothetical protein